MIEIFILMFSGCVVGVLIYWIFGEGKIQQQKVANILIYLWLFMLFGSIVGLINWLIV